MILAAGSIVGELSGDTGETILRGEVFGSRRGSLEEPRIGGDAAKPKSKVVFFVNSVRLERDWLPEALPETDVSQEYRIWCPDLERHVVERNSKRPVVTRDLGTEESSSVAELAEQPRERSIQLVTEASPPPADDLVEKTGFVDLDGDTERDIEVLERNREEMLEVKASEGTGRGTLPRRTDSLQVLSSVHDERSS
jgi:hypothetical protein